MQVITFDHCVMPYLEGHAGEICLGGRQSGRQMAAAGIAAVAVAARVGVMMVVMMPGEALLQQPPHCVESLCERAGVDGDLAGLGQGHRRC